MIKQGKIKKSIKGVGDNKSCNLVFLGDESCRIYNFMHPVAEKGEEIHRMISQRKLLNSNHPGSVMRKEYTRYNR